MSNDTTPALHVSSVSHSYGARQALEGVSLSVGQGAFCGLLGLNGAGKTTLFSLITRLFDNTSGHVRVMGHDVRRAPKLALQNLGVVFQNRTLDPDLSVLQNMTYHAALHGIPRRQARERAVAELERAGLADRVGEAVRSLSGGQMRRVEIARALLHQPKLLLLDEPTVGLDVGARRDIISHVRALVGQGGLSVLWATHLMEEINTDDAVVVLHQGKVIETGTSQEIADRHEVGDLKEAFDAMTGLAKGKAA
ncbi:MAG: ATP-binding cassette domain-containing protein [Alphaproteobacteria bacterium]|nr:ATP-binding cassette domain-containing protein [Alphaproteobacteria bacterium]